MRARGVSCLRLVGVSQAEDRSKMRVAAFSITRPWVGIRETKTESESSECKCA